jgi:hypothetical protein
MTAEVANAAVARSTAQLFGVALIEFVGPSLRACGALAFGSGQLQPRSRYTRWPTLRQRDRREWVIGGHAHHPRCTRPFPSAELGFGIDV